MYCHYCGIFIEPGEPSTGDSDGAPRCRAHPEERDAVNEVKDDLRANSRELARVERQLQALQEKRATLEARLAHAEEAYQKGKQHASVSQ